MSDVIRVEDIPSPEGSEGLLAIIVREHYHDDRPVIFFTDPSEPQQLAHMTFTRGHVIRPHRHYELRREVFRTTEVLVVRRGAIWLDVYSSVGVWVGRYLLARGDVAILLRGAHGIEVAEDVEMIEIKQGPYQGRDADKVEISSAG